jgi:outer membrane murein-binding lipoprotein Lpp
MTPRKGRFGLLVTASIVGAILLTSCTCKIKEEQQAMINQLRTAEKTMAEDHKKAESDKNKILAELNSRDAEVRKCNEKKAFVQEKLARYPDMWPDWNPNPPAPAEPEAAPETSTTKKKK